jgi:hypothetical protein
LGSQGRFGRLWYQEKDAKVMGIHPKISKFTRDFIGIWNIHDGIHTQYDWNIILIPNSP